METGYGIGGRTGLHPYIDQQAFGMVEEYQFMNPGDNINATNSFELHSQQSKRQPMHTSGKQQISVRDQRGFSAIEIMQWGGEAAKGLCPINGCS